MNSSYYNLTLRQIAFIALLLAFGSTTPAQTLRLVSVQVHLKPTADAPSYTVVAPLYDEDNDLTDGESLQVTPPCTGGSDEVSTMNTVSIWTCENDTLFFQVLYPDLYRTSPFGHVSIDRWEVDGVDKGNSPLISHTVGANVDVDLYLTQSIDKIRRDPVSMRWNPDAGYREVNTDLAWGPAWLTAKSLVSDVDSETYPALLYSGEAYEKQVDLAVKGRGLDFVFSRVHRSGAPEGNLDGDEEDTVDNFGFGGQWTHSFDIQLESPDLSEYSAPAKVYLGNGTVAPFYQKFTVTGSPSYRYFYAEGWDAELELEFVSPNLTYRLRFGDGVVWTFHSFTGTSPQTLQLTSIADRFGNTISLSYDGNDRLETITDTLGRDYTIAYVSGEDRIASLTEQDGLGRVVTYDYNVSDELETVTYPATTAFPSPEEPEISYSYDAAHRLATVTDSRGNQILENIYVDNTLSAQQHGDGPDASFVTFEYSGVVLALGEDHGVHVTDGAGHETKHYFNILNQRVRVNQLDKNGTTSLSASMSWGSHTFTSSLPGTTDFTVSDDLPASITLPDGIVLTYDYTGPGSSNAAYKYRMNVTQVTRTGTDAKALVEAFGHNDLGGSIDYWDARFGESFVTCHTLRDGAGTLLSGTAYTYSSDDLATLDGIDYMGIAPYGDDPFGDCGLSSEEAMAAQFESLSQTFDLLQVSDSVYDNTMQQFATSSELYSEGDGEFLMLDGGGMMLSSMAAPDHHESFGYNAYGQITEQLHPDNDEDGDPGDRVRRRDTYHYDSNGYLDQYIVDADGEALLTTYTNDAIGRSTAVTNPKSEVTNFAYDALDQVISVTKPALDSAAGERPKTTLHYDANGNLRLAREYWFDQDGTPIAAGGETDPNNDLATEYTYDTRNRLVAIGHEDGTGLNTSEFHYDGNGNVILERSPRAVTNAEPDNIVAYEYDERDLPIRVTRGNTSITRIVYDLGRRPIRTVEGYGTAEARVTVMTYDGLGNLATKTDATGLTTQFTKDALGRTTGTKAMDGSTVLAETANVYALPGRLTHVFAKHRTETGAKVNDGWLHGIQTYTDAGMPLASTEEGITTTYEYDTAMRLARMTTPGGNIQEYAYDENGNVTVATEKAYDTIHDTTTDFVTRYAYDELDRVVSVGLDDGDGDTNDAKTTTYAYDSLDQMAETVDARGNHTANTYDPLGRLTLTNRDDGGINAAMGYDYDENGRLTARTDPSNRTTTFAYDALNRATLTTYADGRSEHNEYNALDLTTTHVAADGLKTSITRDTAGRPIMTQYANLAGRATPGDTAVQYDKLSQVTRASTEGNSVTRSYDTLGHATIESVQNGVTTLDAVHQTYDGKGRLYQIDPPGDTNALKFLRDEEGKVAHLFQNGQAIAHFDYLGARPADRGYRRGNATRGSTQVEYDPTGRRPAGILHLDRWNNDVDDHSYTWDDAYNLDETQATDPGDPENSHTLDFDYDGLNRLDTDSADFDPAWSFDESGNREGTGYTQNGQDALMHRYTAVDGLSQFYDAQGALVQAGSDADSIFEYHYDVNGRLVNYRDVTIATTTVFDPLDIDDGNWQDPPFLGTWAVDDNGTTGDATDDFLKKTNAGGAAAILYTPDSPIYGGISFAYRSTHDPDDPDGDTTPAEFNGDDFPGRFYAQILFVISDAGPPYSYCALRIEPDRLAVVTFDGTTLKELDTTAAVTEAGTWYTVKLRFEYGGPNGGTLLVERTSETDGDPAVKLMQSVPLTELPEINGAHMGFSLGADADYHFKLLDYGLAPDIAETYVDWSYDAFGRKIAESVYDGSTLTAQTVYVWDGWRLLSEVDGLTGKPEVEYIPGPGYVDDVIASRRDLNHNGSFEDDETFYHLTDQQYSTTALLDSGGHLVERYDYDPFGVPSVYAPDGTPRSQSAYGNTRLYTGRQWLPALGLYDYRQRLYNPHTGRFLSTDPAYDPANLGNPYTYVGNNPYGFVDPYGEDAIDFLVTGHWNPDENTWQQAYSGFGLGAAEGQTVIANAATLGLNSNLNAQAQIIKADAKARGDVVSQIGFGLGEVGVEAGYAAVGGYAVKGALTSGRGTAFVIRHAIGVRRATQASSIVAASVGGYHVGSSVVALSQGDYERTIHDLGSAALSFSGARFGAKSAPGKLGNGPLRIGSVEPPAKVRPGTTTFGNKMHEEIGNLLKNRFKGVENADEIIYRLGPGQRGVDIEVPRRFTDTFGFRYLDVKPQSRAGAISLGRQIARWGYAPGEVVPLTYRASGDVYVGF